MDVWRRQLEHLRHSARSAADAVAFHRCLSDGRVEILSDSCNLGRYTAVPCELDDQYMLGGLIWFKIAKPGVWVPYKNCFGHDDMQFRSVSFSRREPLVVEEQLALHLAAALNGGMLGYF